REGAGDALFPVRLDETEDAAAAARAADFARGRASFARALEERVDGRRRDAWRQTLAMRPLGRQVSGDARPVLLFERVAYADGRVANRVERRRDVRVAIDAPHHHVPVIDPGISRRAGVAEDEAALELGEVDRERRPRHTGDAQLDRRDAAIERRAIVLDARWDADDL